MGRINQLPFIAGCAAAVVTGIVSYASGMKMSSVYMRMAVMMLVFFVLGMYIRKTITDIEKEVQEKKEEQLRIEENSRLQQKEIEKAAASAVKLQTNLDWNSQNVKHQEQHKLDLSAGDMDDEFQPLMLSKAVSTKVKE